MDTVRHGVAAQSHLGHDDYALICSSIVQPFRPDGFTNAYKLLKDTGDYARVAGPPPPDPGYCEDTNDRCDEWASAGECDKNPGFMKGEGSDQPGHCRKACGTCTECAEGDRTCYRENREAAGYLDLSEEVQQMMAA